MNSDVNYEKKYLKYKQKYIELKKQIGGACKWNNKKEPQNTKCQTNCSKEQQASRKCYGEDKVYAGPTGCDYICKNNSWKFLDKPAYEPTEVGETATVNGVSFTASRLLGVGPLKWSKN